MHDLFARYGVGLRATKSKLVIASSSGVYRANCGSTVIVVELGDPLGCGRDASSSIMNPAARANR